MVALLQVALDLTSIKEALAIALEAVKGGADIIEVGTPLLKAEGLHSVRVLRETFKGRRIVADMKIMDAGELEAELALKAGADVVTVLGVASLETLKRATVKAHELGGKVMVDMMEVKEVRRKVEEAVKLDVDYICLHVGLDVQRAKGVSARELAERAERIKSEYGVKVAVAGGIDEFTAPLYRDLDIVIVGGAITKSPNPREATERILRAMGKL